jgi:glycosyltransferase involved in cell wall biosynthesis
LLSTLDKEKFQTLLVVGGVQLGEVEDSRLLDLDFVRLEHLGRRINLIKDIRSYFALRRVIKEFNPHVIHTHTFKAGALGRLCFFKIPKIHTYHGHLLTDPEFSKFAKKIIVRVERDLARLTKTLVVTGEQVAKDLLSVGVGKNTQYFSIPGGVLPMQLLPRDESRGRLNLKDEFTVLWMGRVAPVKNPDLLLQVAKKMPDVVFILAGDGILLDIIQKSDPPNVKILGFVNPINILSAADVFLSTSMNEGMPYSILEAQSARLPVVAVNVGALSEVISDSVNGYLVEPSAEKIMDKLTELQSNRDLLEKMSLAAGESDSGEYFFKTLSTKHIELYEKTTLRNQFNPV